MGKGEHDKVLTVFRESSPAFGKYIVPAMIFLVAGLFGVFVGMAVGDAGSEIRRLGQVTADLSIRVGRLEGRGSP